MKREAGQMTLVLLPEQPRAGLTRPTELATGARMTRLSKIDDGPG